MEEPNRWQIVYWDNGKGRSRIDNEIDAFTREEALSKFQIKYPSVTRIIGAYEMRKGGCNC
ncbi:hypothetical protein LIS04_33 [Listeria phage LIS04]|nr:hypothetical protein LIS04_33 [Listeria phage LIS04]